MCTKYKEKKGLFFLYLPFGSRHILSVWLYLLHILLQMNSFDHVLGFPYLGNYSKIPFIFLITLLLYFLVVSRYIVYMAVLVTYSAGYWKFMLFVCCALLQ